MGFSISKTPCWVELSWVEWVELSHSDTQIFKSLSPLGIRKILHSTSTSLISYKKNWFRNNPFSTYNNNKWINRLIYARLLWLKPRIMTSSLGKNSLRPTPSSITLRQHLHRTDLWLVQGWNANRFWQKWNSN